MSKPAKISDYFLRLTEEEALQAHQNRLEIYRAQKPQIEARKVLSKAEEETRRVSKQRVAWKVSKMRQRERQKKLEVDLGLRDCDGKRMKKVCESESHTSLLCQLFVQLSRNITEELLTSANPLPIRTINRIEAPLAASKKA